MNAEYQANNYLTQNFGTGKVTSFFLLKEFSRRKIVLIRNSHLKMVLGLTYLKPNS